MSDFAPTQLARAGSRRLSKALRGRRRLTAGIVQLGYVVAAIAIGRAVPEIHIGVDIPRDVVVSLLLTIGVGMIGFIGVVYSLLFLVVQFGMTTFTPRLTLFRDSSIVWHAFGYFTAVAIFSFAAAFSLGGDEDVTVVVPVLTAALVLIALVVFRILQTTAFNSIQLASTLSQVSRRTRRVVDDMYPDKLTDDSEAAGTPTSTDPAVPIREVCWQRPAAILQSVDVPALLRLAEQAGIVIDLRAGVGEVIQEDAVVAVLRGSEDPSLDHRVQKALTVGYERTFEQDPGFGLQVLSDIATRAMSPAVNDPHTVVQVLDRVESLLRVLAVRDLDIGLIEGSDGTARVALKLPTWENYVSVILDEVMVHGLRSPQVCRRLQRMLADLAEIAPAIRRPALQSRIEQVSAVTETTQ